MGEDLKELSFGVGSISAAKSISRIFAEVSKIDDFAKKSSRLDFYVQSLEGEMRKIDAFKRELPLCMHLLRDAIEILEEEKLKLNRKEMGPEIEEFLPLKCDSKMEEGSKRGNAFSEKRNWMSSAQLWSNPVQYENSFNPPNQDSVLHQKSKTYEVGESSGSGSRSQPLNFKNRGGGAFVPFEKPSGLTINEETRDVPVYGLSLSDPLTKKECSGVKIKEDCGSFGRPQMQQILQRKQRRCWSLELHERFVEALGKLGGAKVATPKQIRELMKVDGLTNDEVKSHLQKYRIHIRKPPVSISSTGEPDYSWLSREKSGESSKAAGSDSGSGQGPQHEGGSGTGGDSTADNEAYKSESHSWRGGTEAG